MQRHVLEVLHKQSQADVCADASCRAVPCRVSPPPTAYTHTQAVRAVSASPTDQMFASCSDDHMSPIVVWDLATSTATTLIGGVGWGRVDWGGGLTAGCCGVGWG